MSRIQNKASRLSQIEAILLAHPQGVTQADLARQLQVDRSTINRDLVDLPTHIYIDDLDGGRLKIDRETYLVNVRLNLHEALAVHLAARLLATRMERQNRHAAGALRKLGLALDLLAPQISLHLQQSADVMDDPSRRQDPRYLGVLEKLTLAWAEKRKVQVWHRHENGQVLEYIFAPYFIEPYAVGQSTHVIGLRQPPGAMRTFKIERIERVELLPIGLARCLKTSPLSKAIYLRKIMPGKRQRRPKRRLKSWGGWVGKPLDNCYPLQPCFQLPRIPILFKLRPSPRRMARNFLRWSFSKRRPARARPKLPFSWRIPGCKSRPVRVSTSLCHLRLPVTKCMSG
jgi:hypothetical protein